MRRTVLAIATWMTSAACVQAANADDTASADAQKRGGALSRFWNSAAEHSRTASPTSPIEVPVPALKNLAISNAGADLVSQLWQTSESAPGNVVTPVAQLEDVPTLRQPGFISPTGESAEPARAARNDALAQAARGQNPKQNDAGDVPHAFAGALSLLDQLSGVPPATAPLATTVANTEPPRQPSAESLLPDLQDVGLLTTGLWEPFILQHQPAPSNVKQVQHEQVDEVGLRPIMGELLLQPFVLSTGGQKGALVAYQEELPPEPIAPGENVRDRGTSPAPSGEDASLDEETPPDGDDEENDSLAESEQIGEEPEDNTLDFLRTETVLLEPGESQCDVGINYLLTENDFPVLLTDAVGNIVGVDEVNFRVRELSVPLEYRVGLVKRVQGFVGAPIGWSNTQLSLDTFEAFENDGGLGDLDFGLTMQLVDASPNCPYVIATIQATAPTGGDPFRNAVGLAPTAPSLGQGFWSIAGNLLFIQPYDPVVVFYGLGTEHFFSRQFLGLEIEPGAQYNYTFGVGFAVNERITLSTRFFGVYVEEIKVDGERRFGTNAEPMTLRMSATISQPCDRLVEPFLEFGLTDDAVSTFLGITWTH